MHINVLCAWVEKIAKGQSLDYSCALAVIRVFSSFVHLLGGCSDWKDHETDLCCTIYQQVSLNMCAVVVKRLQQKRQNKLLCPAAVGEH